MQARHRKNVQQDDGSRTNRIQIPVSGQFLAPLSSFINCIRPASVMLGTPHTEISTRFTEEADLDLSPF